MDWYVVVKTINGRRYFYAQKTYRDGAHVRTRNRYIGPVTGDGSDGPIQLPLALTTTTTDSLPPKRIARPRPPAFDRAKADTAFDLVMGSAVATWRHHWHARRRGATLVVRNPQIDALLRKRRVKFTHNTTGCYYAPSRDVVNIPPLRCFEEADGQSATSAYYVVVFHEIVHWTLPRVQRAAGSFGEAYAREELVAELGAVMLMAHFGLEIGFAERHALYFQTWLGRAGDRQTALAHARKEAVKAVQWILSHED